MMMKLKTGSVLAKYSLAAFGVAILSACSTPQSPMPPTSNWANIEIAESVERLELYARPDGFALSARDETAVAIFLESYGRYGDGPLYMNVPHSHHYAAGVEQARYVVSQLMGNLGLGGAPIQTGKYQVAFGAPAPIVVSYRRLKTVPIDCRTTGNLVDSGHNRAYDGFGCSFHANLAAMVEDPRQFLEPNPIMPPDMKRRMEVYDKYIKGENPASQQPDRQEISAESSGGSGG